jgi:tRNA-2-methylthio-N6-dimethylallyladenosine synthase
VAKKLFIKTYGCQMNVYDSTRMVDTLAPIGYEPVDSPDGADMIILNTCHIREKAAEKVYSDLGRLKVFKDKKAAGGDKMILAVAGCVAQAEGAEIMRRSPQVDMVFGPQTYHRLPELVAKATREASTGRSNVLDTDFPVESKFDHLPEESRSQGPAAFLTIQEGCDKFCTFCVVPYTRGSEFSRPVAEIEAEARRLVAGGAKEITLLGQNVNAYHGERKGREVGLGHLIRHLSEIDGLERLRFTTSHPKDMSEDLYEAFANEPKLMPYFHLPVQAGSDRVLAAMNRTHTADDYRRIVDRLRTARSDLALSGDFIIGFPGETDLDFSETIKLITDVSYSQAYSFKYSPRPGTPAASLGNQVEESVMSERLAMVQSLLTEQQHAFNMGTIGKKMPVLLERKGRMENQLIGRSPYMQSVHLTASERLYGSMVEVEVTDAKAHSVGATIITREWETTAVDAA